MEEPKRSAKIAWTDAHWQPSFVVAYSIEDEKEEEKENNGRKNAKHERI